MYRLDYMPNFEAKIDRNDFLNPIGKKGAGSAGSAGSAVKNEQCSYCIFNINNPEEII